jgi:UDP-4-amino-4,6-dideoxy-N-acetyl-beta-L-altrosamine N-acetyltransferase
MQMLKNSEIKPIKFEDLHQVLEWRNKEHIRKNMYNENLITLDQHYRWFESLKLNPDKKTYLFYLNGSPKGVINFNVDVDNAKCDWGFYLGGDLVPKGTGALMGYLAIEHAFKKLKVRKITGEVFDFNEKSQLYHQNLGFVQEGIFKSHIRKKDFYHDIYIYSLFKDQWEYSKTKTEKFLKTVYKER